MGGWSEDLLVGLANAPWQPKSLRAPVREEMPLRLRLGLLLGVVLLHVVLTLAFPRLLETAPEPVAEEAILIDFVELPPPEPVPTAQPNETITIHRPPPAPARPTDTPANPAPPRPTRRPSRDVPMQVVEAPARPLELYKPDGSLRLPEDMLDKLDERFGDKRTFSFQVPHMDDAKKYFERNPALVYEETRFDQYWTPDEDALNGLLRKFAEATTKEVKVKVPGMGGSSYVVCKVSILALGGGCGVVTSGADWNGPQDDPNTLNPEEERQCAAWWQQIIDARTQDAWRATRKLYERECRKPRLRAAIG